VLFFRFPVLNFLILGNKVKYFMLRWLVNFLVPKYFDRPSFGKVSGPLRPGSKDTGSEKPNLQLFDSVGTVKVFTNLVLEETEFPPSMC
jgi:hypothetical protein